MLGRPKLPKNEIRARRVTVFMTEKEYRNLKRLAREQGMIPGHVMRNLLQKATG